MRKGFVATMLTGVAIGAVTVTALEMMYKPMRVGTKRMLRGQKNKIQDAFSNTLDNIMR